MANISLRCPKCSRTMEVARDATDPPNAMECVIICERCDDGDRHAPQYFTASGKWIELSQQGGTPWTS